ncbi:uncharacterized protein MCYG_02844 [Microsporum canis CBS 113480]|uniref:Uncharacterized protein n=1 Tax=Arthroderma otae (strain ATCC MYA-4605 / CBS 113480) TaxID=554155 RepID=C5FK03_ARTOC|nr:uncharacterized protein MCYG_02844 [Microsporum canis CBS 113480]EEQ30025.1 predicted protein [Microsporum canis CBS 113480]
MPETDIILCLLEWTKLASTPDYRTDRYAFCFPIARCDYYRKEEEEKIEEKGVVLSWMRYALLAPTQYRIHWFDSLFESTRDTALMFMASVAANPALHLYRCASSFLHSSSCISNHFNDKSIETDSTSEFPMMFALNMSINIITVGIWLFATRDRTVVSPDDQTMTPQELNQN